MSKRILKAAVLVLTVVLIAGIVCVLSPENTYGAGNYPDPSMVCIGYPEENDNRFFGFSSNRYYKNGDTWRTGMTGTSNDWNAYYDETKGQLYLKNYNGPTICVFDGNGEQFVVYVYPGTENTISGKKYGIVASDIQLWFIGGVGSQLTVNVNNKDKYEWPCAGIANYTWNDEQPEQKRNIIIGNTLDIDINVNSAGNGCGIVAGSGLSLSNQTGLNIDLRTVSKELDYFPDSYVNAAIYSGGANMTIATNQIVDVCVYDEGSWPENYAYYTGAVTKAIDLSAETCPIASFAIEMAWEGSPSIGRKVMNFDVPFIDGYDREYKRTDYITNTVVFTKKYSYFDCVHVIGGYFPDPWFRDYIKYNFDDGDGILDIDELENAEVIDFDGEIYYDDDFYNARSLSGVEKLTSLVDLIWKNACLADTLDLELNGTVNYVDVSGNGALPCVEADSASNLEYLDFSNCNVKGTFDIFFGEKLKNINCSNNKLTDLWISNLEALKILDCSNNELTSLSSSAWPELTQLACYSNKLETLHLGSSDKLIYVGCYDNNLTVLDISQCPKIKRAFLEGTRDDKGTYYRYGMRAGSGAYALDVDKDTAVVTDTAVFNGASLSLKDKISVNMYFKIPDSAQGWKAKVYYEKDGFASVKYTYDLKTTASYYSSKNEEYKIVFPDISAKEIIERVRVKIFDGSGNPVMMLDVGNYLTDHIDYSAAGWATEMIYTESRPKKTQDLAMALLNLGGEAQKYFDYKTDHNANYDGWLGYSMEKVTADDLKSFAGITDANASAVGLDASPLSLSLKNETYLNIYFNNSITATATNLDKAKLTVSKNGSDWVAKITGITAKNLGRQYTITVKGNGKTSTIKYSALSWAYSVLQKGTNAKAIPLAKALYLYQQAAEQYFSN